MAGLVSSATLEQIRAASDIVEVIGAVLPLKRAGANFVALCPFHKEKTPSFNVNPHKQLFHCYGCHKGGDVFSFIQEYENVSFVEAVQRLAERARIPLQYENAPGQEQKRFLKDQLFELHEQITRRWHTCLLNEPGAEGARQYLAQRGVSQEAISLFRIGYAPDVWDDTVNWAKAKRHDLSIVEQAGLIARKEGQDRFYDRFRGRLIFPISDEQGRVVAFSGRILSAEAGASKYVNSPETPIFTKGKIFYGLDKSKRPILDKGYAVVCEGQLDLIACYTAGIQNVVAPQGTAFTSDHARILKRYVDEVVLCFDADPAGQNAAVRVFDSLLCSGLAVRVATIPAPHDPDSFIKAFGGPALQERIEKAEGFFDFYLNLLCQTHDPRTDKGRLAISRAMAEALHKTGSAILLDTYAQKTALRLGVAPQSTRTEFQKRVRRGSREPDEPAAPPPSATPPSEMEAWLLKLLLTHDELVDWAAAYLDLSWVQHPKVREVVQLRFDAGGSDDGPGTAALLARTEDPELRRLISEAVAKNRPIPNPEQQLHDLVLRLRNQALERQINALTQKGLQSGLTEDELQLQQHLRRCKQQPLEPLGNL